jgi:hypothetical protein
MPQFNNIYGTMLDIDHGLLVMREAIPGEAITKYSSNPRPDGSNINRATGSWRRQ